MSIIHILHSICFIIIVINIILSFVHPCQLIHNVRLCIEHQTGFAPFVVSYFHANQMPHAMKNTYTHSNNKNNINNNDNHNNDE